MVVTQSHWRERLRMADAKYGEVDMVIASVVLANRMMCNLLSSAEADRLGVKSVELLEQAQAKAKELVAHGFKTIKVGVLSQDGDFIALLVGPDFEEEAPPKEADAAPTVGPATA